MRKASFNYSRTILNRVFSLGMFSLIMAAVTSCACTDNRRPEANKNKNEKNHEVAEAAILSVLGPIQKAQATIKSFEGGDIKGNIIFTKVADGVQIVANVEGLTPGKHGFHVHEFGDCSGDGAATGAHFNPTHSKHGGPDSPERHVGDLGNIVADQDGRAHYERIDKLIVLEGQNSVIGRSIVIHADADDYTTQPTGNSGKKIACGVIEAVTIE